MRWEKLGAGIVISYTTEGGFPGRSFLGLEAFAGDVFDVEPSVSLARATAAYAATQRLSANSSAAAPFRSFASTLCGDATRCSGCDAAVGSTDTVAAATRSAGSLSRDGGSSAADSALP